MDTVRSGKVSSVDYESGMCAVTYGAQSGNTTISLPVLSFTGEYRMPAVGDNVLVLHFPTGGAAGVVLGRYWNEKNKPAKTGEGVFYKELGKNAFMHYDEKAGVLTIEADHIVLKSGESISLDSASVVIKGEEHVQ